MRVDVFNRIFEARIDWCRKTLIEKGHDYAKDGDRLHNFRTAGRARNKCMTTALEEMALKHIVSMWDIVDTMEEDKLYVPEPEYISEKLGDIINYMVLLEAAIEDRRAALATSAPYDVNCIPPDVEDICPTTKRLKNRTNNPDGSL